MFHFISILNSFIPFGCYIFPVFLILYFIPLFQSAKSNGGLKKGEALEMPYLIE